METIHRQDTRRPLPSAADTVEAADDRPEALQTRSRHVPSHFPDGIERPAVAPSPGNRVGNKCEMKCAIFDQTGRLESSHQAPDGRASAGAGRVRCRRAGPFASAFHVRRPGRLSGKGRLEKNAQHLPRGTGAVVCGPWWHARPGAGASQRMSDTTADNGFIEHRTLTQRIRRSRRRFWRRREPGAIRHCCWSVVIEDK